MDSRQQKTTKTLVKRVADSKHRDSLSPDESAETVEDRKLCQEEIRDGQRGQKPVSFDSAGDEGVARTQRFLRDGTDPFRWRIVGAGARERVAAPYVVKESVKVPACDRTQLASLPEDRQRIGGIQDE